MANLSRTNLRSTRDFKNVLDSVKINSDFKYISTSDDYDYSGLEVGDYTIVVNVAMADGKFIRLPEATTSNAGMKIKVLIALSPADNMHVGFVTTNIVGGVHGVSDATEGVAAGYLRSSAVGDANLRMTLDVDGAAGDGAGYPGTCINFTYVGVENSVFVDGYLLGDVDSATGANVFNTTAVNA